MDFLFGIGSQIIWLILLVLGVLLAALGWGAKKKADGRAQERERARVARETAAKDAEKIREQTVAKPIEKQREDLRKWER